MIKKQLLTAEEQIRFNQAIQNDEIKPLPNESYFVAWLRQEKEKHKNRDLRLF